MGALFVFLRSPFGRYLAGAGAVLLLLAAAYHHVYSRGYAARDAACQAATAVSIRRATEQATEIARQDAEVSAGVEAARARIQRIYTQVEKEVVREIPANCAQCRINPGTLGLLNRVLSGEVAASEFDQSVRTPDPLGGGKLP